VYLEKLKLFGFKSFANKTELKFLPGITAIVGPNGCGKSNIVDALRWVLGEQKAGALRSDRMESVIFNGSKSMKPLGMAEVSLVIQNTNGILPVEYSEVVITRRLFRSGESQYLLNNNSCRLKDINDLLMDTGLAPDAYSVIELKMVEQILNGKPEDRRRIFEEAVGITRYKQRRKLTIRKLEATEQDLLRVADIIGEVRSKVNSLHRQVRRAQRYMDLSKKLKESEIRLATHQFSTILSELEPLNQKYEELKRNRESLTSQISFKEAEFEAVQTELIDLEQKLREEQGRLNEKKADIQKKEEEILLDRERLKSLAENKIRLEKEIEELKQRIKIRREQLAETSERRSTTVSELKDLQESYEGEKKKLDELDAELAAKRQKIRDAEQESLSIMQLIAEKERSLERFRAQLDGQNERITAIEQEKVSLLEKMDEDETARQEIKKRLEKKISESEMLSDEQTELELRAEKLQAEIGDLKGIILKTNNQIESVRQKSAFLKDLLENYADYPEGVKYLMTEKPDRQKFIGAFADKLQVKEDYRRAIEAALGEASTFLVVSDRETAYLGVSELAEAKKGMVTFLPVDKIQARKTDANLKEVPGFVGKADELARSEEKLRPAVEVLLGSYLVFRDLESAKKARDRDDLQQFHFVTLDGESLFNWGGVRGGKKEGETGSIVGRQAQLQELQQREQDLYGELDKAEKLLGNKEQEYEDTARKISSMLKTMKNLQEEIRQIQIELSQTDYRIQQAKLNLQRFDGEIQLIRQNQQTLSAQMQEIEPELATVSATHKTTKNEIDVQVKSLQEFEQMRNKQAEKVNRLNISIVEITGNEKNLLQTAEQTERLIQEHEQAIRDREAELVKNRDTSEELAARIEELTTSLTDDYAIKEELEKRAAELESEAQSLREKIDTKNKEVRELRSEREKVADEIHQLELRISELKIRGDNLYRHILEEYDHELKQETVDTNYQADIDEQEIETTKQKIKNLGPVNMLALNEYEKEKERLDFLEKQQEDLISAEQNLKETIEHINQTAQDKFDAIFNDIRENFITVFKRFFPEGQADLMIEQDGDPLEANIEIIANPKGKKMESLTLLSQGEKAMTAISLLFGIYLVKPSPICILDEVDAPLDDNNVKRFLKTLDEFSNNTQFLVVTHNKITMKAANSLYGVTMEESGVSKIVSVKLD